MTSHNKDIMTTELMGELRSLLHQPSDASWQQLCRLLLYTKNLRNIWDQAIPYCHDLIQSWPRRIHRTAPPAVSAILQGKQYARRPVINTLAVLSLCTDCGPKDIWHYHEPAITTLPETWPPLPGFTCRHLTLHIHQTPPQLIRYLTQHEMPELFDVQLLSSRRQPLNMALARSIGQAPWSKTNIKNLHITWPHDMMRAFLDHADLSHVHILSISEAQGQIDEHALLELFDATSPECLRRLDCNSAWLERGAAEIIALHPHLENLTRLDMRFNMGVGHDGLDAILHSEVISAQVRWEVEQTYEDIFE